MFIVWLCVSVLSIAIFVVVVVVCIRLKFFIYSTFSETHLANAFLNFTSNVSSTIRLFISNKIMVVRYYNKKPQPTNTVSHTKFECVKNELKFIEF